MDSLSSTNGPPAIRQKSKTWIWYFVLLAVLTAAATTTLIVFNLKQQLTPQQLAAAQALWKKHGPESYDLEYTKEIGETKESYAVRVRNGEVVDVMLNDKPIERRLYRYHSMPELFGFIEGFLEIDSKPGRPRAFARATFDEEDGHLKRYTRSVSSPKERVEIIVTKFEAK
jgi:uncharacterized protein DUF6174